MKTKDAEKVTQNQIDESTSLNYYVEEDENGIIKRILINNYRDNERLNEIFNTSTWVFTRMIEKQTEHDFNIMDKIVVSDLVSIQSLDL